MLNHRVFVHHNDSAKKLASISWQSAVSPLPPMSIHHFTLIVDGPDLQDSAIIDRLFEAGCDDAATGRSDGIQCVDFDREAASLDEAVLSAIRDVEHVDGVSVVRVADAGLVSMTDIVSRIGSTRERPM